MWQRIVTRVVSNGDSDTGIRSDSAVVASLSLVTCGGHWPFASGCGGPTGPLVASGDLNAVAILMRWLVIMCGDSDADHTVASGHSDAVATRMPYLGTVQQRLGCGGRP